MSMDVFPGLDGGLDVSISFFGLQGAALGSTQVSASAENVSEFMGVISNVAMSRIELTTSEDGGELIDNLRFGTALDPIFQDRFEDN